jgi:hypothetical protein
LTGPAKIVDASVIDPVSDDVIDLIAAEQDSSEEEDDTLTDAVDAAMADLL